MIATDLDHIEHQVLMTPALRKAFAFLSKPGLLDLPDGRVDLDGDRVYALIQRYATMPAGAPKFEYHRKYIDVQFIVAGSEIIGWAPRENMSVTDDYDTGKDVCFGTVAEGAWTPVHLGAGKLAVLWPEDAHAPKLAAGSPSTVVKIVVKVAV